MARRTYEHEEDPEEAKRLNEFLKSQGIDISDQPRLHARSRAISRMAQDTDRGVGIVGAAFVDEELSRCIKRYLVQTSSAHRERIKYLTEIDGTLGSFDIQIDLAWLMGCINNEVRSNLQRIRNIRNTFAHDFSVATFDHPLIKPDCERLTITESFLSKNEDGSVSLRYPPGGAIGTYSKEFSPIPFPSLRARYIFTCVFFINVLPGINSKGVTHQPPF